MITDEQLKAWRMLCEAALPAPWSGHRYIVAGNGYHFAQVDDTESMRFVLAARTVVPVLLDEVERLRRLELLVRADERERIAKRIELFNGHVVNKHFVSQFVASGKASGPAEEQDAAMLVRRG